MVCYHVVLEHLERYLHFVIISTTKPCKMFEYLVESFGSHRIVRRQSRAVEFNSYVVKIEAITEKILGINTREESRMN